MDSANAACPDRFATAERRFFVELQLDQKQQQTLSPQMIQSMKVLQMGIQELREYVEEILQENPMLELQESEEKPLELPDAARELEWLRASDSQNLYYHAQDAEGAQGDALSNLGCFLDDENSLSRYILSQFLGICLEPEVMAGVEFLVARLDGCGYLEEDMEELIRASGLSPAVMSRALIELQAADPAGVGARDLSECLRLQLERRQGDHRLALQIVQDHLEALAHRRYGLISRALGAPEREVRTACELIRSLNPKPGSGFAAPENLAYITPDIVVTVYPDRFDVSANDSTLPQLRLSAYYGRLLRETGEQEVRNYLTERARQAKWVVGSIQQRRDTLLQCAQWIVERQASFFRLGCGHLVPLTMGDAARALGVHESTVSRTVRDKYLQCNWGIYPLSWFFSRALGGDAVSPEMAKALLRKLVEEERTSLSDQKLCEEMARRGCPISRRTVAKYRSELGIPSASGRKP